MTPDPSALPAIAPATAALANRLAASQWLLAPSQEAEGVVPPLDVRFVPAPSPAGHCVDIAIATDFGVVFLCVEAGLVDLSSDGLLPGWREEPADSLPLEWRAVMALEVFAGGTIFENIRVLDARSVPGLGRADGPPLARMLGTVAAAGHDFGFSIHLSGLGRGAVAALSHLQPHGRLNGFDPGFCCRAYLRGRPVAPAAYRALQTGDVLLAGTVEEGRLPILLEVPAIARFSAALSLSTGAIENFENAGTNESMSDIEDDVEPPAFEAGTVYDEPPLGDPAENVPVRLDFLLSSRRISLSELRALGPGATLDLKIDLTQPVTILANGAPAAKGYLVQIGGYVGVQISHWPGTRQNGDG